MATASSSICQESGKTNRTTPTSCDEFGPNLPPELIAAILSRLHVKSLLRFRCVCKSWRSLISNPKFVKTHLSLASINPDYTHHRLLLRDKGNLNDLKSCSLFAVLHEHSDSPVELDCPFTVPWGIMPGFIGSCDGLVCIAILRELYIWNPSTRKSKRLPDAEIPNHYSRRYGFGYDESIDDYKVVGLFGDMGRSASEVKVYTLRSDSWRRIGDVPHCILAFNGSGTFVNGALHWIVRTQSNIIVSLDLAKEMFAEVFQPDHRYGRNPKLYVSNGCLCIVCDFHACAEIWVMKEYGIRESWTKLAVIPNVPELWNRYSKLLCISKNGEILLNSFSHLVRCNPKHGTFSYSTLRNYSEAFTADTYVESLVLPEMDADSGVQLQHQH